MHEMLLIGRGGEGVVLASQVMAEAFGRAGFSVQTFPEFTAERRGAPIAAFLRWDETSPIHRRHKMKDCDVLVVVSPSPPSPQVLRAVRPGGLVVLNRDSRFPHTAPFEIARVPASRIARRDGVLSSEGRPMGNMAMLGACVKLLMPQGLELLVESVESRMGVAGEANVRAAREGYARCTRQRSRTGDTELEPPSEAPGTVATRRHFAISAEDSRRNRTGTWSLERPVLTGECTACAVCALFCPEASISRSDGGMVVDYLHCKGCGICEAVCPVRGAVAMEEVAA
jgi:pyruvate ferredoxin oxidoreductase gamma subunit